MINIQWNEILIKLHDAKLHSGRLLVIEIRDYRNA